MVDELLATRLARLLEEHPTYGYRRLWALLRHRDGVQVDKKTVYRVLRIKVGWYISAARRRGRACKQSGAWLVKAMSGGRSMWHIWMRGRTVELTWWP